MKRVRTEEETVGTKYSNQGYIQIKEANADGKYVKLFNSGSKVSLSNVNNRLSAYVIVMCSPGFFQASFFCYGLPIVTHQ